MRANAAWVLVFVALAGMAGGARTLRVQAMDHAIAADRYEGSYLLPTPAALRVISLGHREALADVFWMRALVYYGDELRHRGELAHVLDYVDAMIALDPDFRAVYLWAGSAALYHTRAPTVDEARRAVALLERAARRWPDDGEIAWELGATLSYELAPLLEGRAKEDARLRGAEHLAAAARLGHGPEWLVLSNAATLRRLGQRELAIRHLEEMYAVMSDPEMRSEIEAQIAQLRSEAEAEAMRETVRAFERDRRREYPYAPDTLYLLLRPRWDWDWTWRDDERDDEPVD